MLEQYPDSALIVEGYQSLLRTLPSKRALGITNSKIEALFFRRLRQAIRYTLEITGVISLRT